MKIRNFQDLKVWQKAHELVLLIYRVTKSFPNEEKFGIVIQIRRSAASICSNIAEGYMKSRLDFLRYLDISRGSLEETKYHLILARDLGYCAEDEYFMLINLSNEVGRMMFGLQQSLRNKKV